MDRPFRTWRSWVVLASTCVLCCAVSPTWAQGTLGNAAVDPVEELRQAIKEDRNLPPIPDFGIERPKAIEHTKNILEFREKTLTEKVNMLKSLSDLRRALMLPEWREDVPSSTNEIYILDLKIRKLIVREFMKGVRRDVERGGRERRLAVARMIADIPPTFRSPGGNETASFTRELTDDVIKLSEDKDRGVAEQALNALGVINAEPATAAARFSRVFTDGPPEFRFRAANGLKMMMEVGNGMRKGSELFKASVSREGLALIAHEVVPACVSVLQDPSVDWRVRAVCLEAVHQAAVGLESLVATFKINVKDVPPAGRPLSEAEVAQIVKQYELIRKDFTDVEEYFKLFQKAAPLAAASLADGNLPVRLSAMGALLSVARARYVRSNRLAILPLDRKTEEKIRREKALIVLEDPLGEVLQKWFAQITSLHADPNTIVRQKVYEFLELLEMDAVPALPALLDGLDDRAPDSVVPSITARTFKTLVILEFLRRKGPDNPNRIPPPPPRLADEEMKAAVPGLARLLRHPQVVTRQEAAKALEVMGPLAGGARRELGTAIRSTVVDVESRLLVFPVIAGLAAEDAHTLVPDLVENLKNADWRLREGAAKALGQIGPAASDAVPALRPLIGDAVDDVRRAACDALLKIVPAPEGNS